MNAGQPSIEYWKAVLSSRHYMALLRDEVLHLREQNIRLDQEILQLRAKVVELTGRKDRSI